MILEKKIFAVLLVHLVLVEGGNEKSIPCPLKWKLLSNGDRIPLDAVASHEALTFVVRDGSFSNYVIGSYDMENHEAYFPGIIEADGNATAKGYFEILTNPYSCLLEWKPSSDGEVPSKFGVRGEDPNDKEFVGRAADPDNLEGKFYSGGISKLYNGIRIAVEEGAEPVYLNEYDSLISYSKGLILELVDFEFDTDPLGTGGEFMAMDIIKNDSPITIKQSLTHKKKIMETTSVTTNQTWTSIFTETFKLNLFFFSITKTDTKKFENAVSETVKTTTENEIGVTREILVPPFTHIQACSVVNIKEAVKVQYKATARYTAPGLKAEEVIKILKDGDISNARVSGPHVLVNADGEFTAKLAMNTQFIVTQGGGGPGEDCNDIKYRLQIQNRVGELMNVKSY